MKYCKGDRVVFSPFLGIMNFVKYESFSSSFSEIMNNPPIEPYDCIICDRDGIEHRALSNHLQLYSPQRHLGEIVRVNSKQWFIDHGISTNAGGLITDSFSGKDYVITQTMMQLCGSKVKICRVTNGILRIDEDSRSFSWSSSMFEFNISLQEKLIEYINVLISEIGITGDERVDMFDISIICEFPKKVMKCNSIVYLEENKSFLCFVKGTHVPLCTNIELLSLAKSLEKIKQNNHC